MPVKQTDKTFTLRIDTALYERIAQKAKKEKRSVNAEILMAIEEHLTKVPVGNPTPAASG